MIFPALEDPLTEDNKRETKLLNESTVTEAAESLT